MTWSSKPAHFSYCKPLLRSATIAILASEELEEHGMGGEGMGTGGIQFAAAEMDKQMRPGEGGPRFKGKVMEREFIRSGAIMPLSASERRSESSKILVAAEEGIDEDETEGGRLRKKERQHENGRDI